MLRITVELIPNGNESSPRRKVLAHAEIGNVRSGALATYHVRTHETGVEGSEQAEIEDYPRWSASIWDLVLRAVAKAEYGQEALPSRPGLLEVPVIRDEGFSYVRLADIPEPICSAFVDNLCRSASSRPPVAGVRGGTAFAVHWKEFQAGER